MTGRSGDGPPFVVAGRLRYARPSDSLPGVTAPPPRPLFRRVGITSLNLLVPGLGLARTGPFRPALVLLAAGPLATLAVAVSFATLPAFEPFGWAALMLLLITAWVAVWMTSLIATWRMSRFRNPHGRGSRWFVLLGLFATATLAADLTAMAVRDGYRMWHAAGEAMLPTLEVGTVFVVDMRRRELPRVGDIAMIAGPDGTEYVKRVVALGGSTVSVRHGIPIVDGRPATQRLVATRQVPDFSGPIPARVVAERLPGDTREHRVLDTEAEGFLDELPPQLVPAGHIYLLGDHRDWSADSRVSRSEGGLAMVPLADVRGIARFALWTADRRWLGTDLTR